MTRANALESQQYNRNQDNLQQAQGQDIQEYNRNKTAADTAYNHSQDAITNQHWNTTNAQSQAQQGIQNAQWSTMNQQQQKQQAIENSVVLKASDATAKQNLLASLPDGPAKNKVMAGLQNGSLTLQNALDSVFGSDGAIKPEYQGQTPGRLGLTVEKEYAQQTVDLQDPNLKNTNPQDYLNRVNAEILKKRNAINSPITAETTAADKAAIISKITSNTPLTPDETAAGIKNGAIPEFTPANLGGYKDQQVADLVGKPINIGGQVYTVLGGGRTRNGSGSGLFGGSTRHIDWTSVKDASGKTLYVWGGKINPTEPGGGNV